MVSWGILVGRFCTRIVCFLAGGLESSRNAGVTSLLTKGDTLRIVRMSPLLVEGDIRAPEVWLRVDTHDRRASPIDVPEPLPRVGDALAVAVGCYAGARGDETPRRFTRGDQLVEILAVVAQWRTPDHRYFRVATGIGKLHQSDAQDGGSKAVAISTNTSSACTIPATDTKRKTMLNSTIERRLTSLIVLLPTLLLGLGIQRAEAQDNERFPYETLRSPAMGLRGSWPRANRSPRTPDSTS